MIERNPILALVLTTLAGIGIIVALYLSLNDPGPPPETEEERFERVHSVFIEAFVGGAAWSGQVEILGLQASRTAAHTPGWQVSGTGGACDPSGSYVIRDQPASSLVITAPHSQSDAGTGELAQLLFEDTSARAVAFNTAPRRASEECEAGVDLSADRWNPFSAFALAFSDADRDGMVMQLHGYEGAESEAAGDVIIGAGLGSSQTINSNLRSCLTGALEGVEIGLKSGGHAASNAQGRVLQVRGHRNFIYLELSDAMRQAMISDAGLRRTFAGCLANAKQS